MKTALGRWSMSIAVLVASLISALAFLGLAFPRNASRVWWNGGQWAGSPGWRSYQGAAYLAASLIGWHLNGLLGFVVVAIVGATIGALTVVALLLAGRTSASAPSILSLPSAVVWWVVSLTETCSGDVCSKAFLPDWML